uniref:Cytochrome P450 CYP405A13 n=1 Tax=Papilio machaon TaxID=76193 RepID=A0A2Z6JJ47_PAPMA|nr:TPA_inf: cytochrome P450 CYP405A13 [Papilio machaon]
MILAVSLVVLVFVLIILHDVLKKKTQRWKHLSKFPGNPPLPLIGNVLEIGFDADEASNRLMEMWKKHGKSNFRLTVGSEEWLLLSEPDDVGTLLSSPTELSKPLERNVAMMPFFGNSVSTSEGERWRSTRKLMNPSFQYKTLEKRVSDVNNYCENLFNIFDKYSGRASVDVYRYLRPYMFDLLCNSLMGVNFHMLDDLDHPYLQASSQVVSFITDNYFSYWRNIRPLFVLSPYYKEMMSIIKIIRNQSTEIIKERRKVLQKFIDDTKNNNKSVNIEVDKLIAENLSDDACLLDKFILSKSIYGDSIPDDVINEEITLVAFTGHYTTTMTMSHTLYFLAKYPEIQQRVYEEQLSVFNNDISKKPTNNDLTEMKYLEAVIKESIRAVPTVTKIGRQLKSDLHFKDGRIAPAGTSVLIFFDALFSNPKVFPEPEKFKPDRFLNNMHQFAFIPFSAGPRNCIGFRYAWVAMKATLSNILRRYEIFPGEPGTEPQFKYRIITESVNGIQLRLKKRDELI